MSDPRANPLAGNPLTTRDDVARAVELTSGRDIVARVQIRLTLLW